MTLSNSAVCGSARVVWRRPRMRRRMIATGGTSGGGGYICLGGLRPPRHNKPHPSTCGHTHVGSSKEMALVIFKHQKVMLQRLLFFGEVDDERRSKLTEALRVRSTRPIMRIRGVSMSRRLGEQCNKCLPSLNLMDIIVNN